MAPEDKVSQADVDKIVAETLASVNREKASRASTTSASSKSAGASAAASQDAEDDDKPDFAEGRDALQAALHAVRQAVAQDTNGAYGAAAVHYDRALKSFGQALQCGLPQGRPAQEKLVESMEGYMNRVQEILLSMEPQPDPRSLTPSAELVPYTSINIGRVETLQAMASVEFKCASRAVALRKQGKAAEEEGNPWAAFIYYSEAIDCFMAYMKFASAASAKTIEKTVLELLDSAESLKQQL